MKRGGAGTGKIEIVDQRVLGAPSLIQYLQKRYIPVDIASKYCREIDFGLYGKKYTAIGFPNDQGGFELRSETFKGGSSPKSPTFFDSGSNKITVFEGFFDFLSFQVLNRGNIDGSSSFLVLNSLAFFHQAKELLDKYQTVDLYLDCNKQGMACTRKALSWNSEKYIDRSEKFRPGQDFNDWFVERQSEIQAEFTLKNMGYRHGKGRGI